MTEMFYETTDLKYLDISNFNTRTCFNFKDMFEKCGEMTLAINKESCSNIISIIPSYVKYKE